MDNIIAAIIKRNNRYLIQDHVKTNLYTLPCGKVEDNESEEDAVIREMKEELGIKVTKLTKHFQKEDFGIVVNGKSYDTITNYFIIDSYEGIIMNKEPHKHRALLWLTKKEIDKLPKTEILKHFMEYGGI